MSDAALGKPRRSGLIAARCYRVGRVTPCTLPSLWITSACRGESTSSLDRLYLLRTGAI